MNSHPRLIDDIARQVAAFLGVMYETLPSSAAGKRGKAIWRSMEVGTEFDGGQEDLLGVADKILAIVGPDLPPSQGLTMLLAQIDAIDRRPRLSAAALGSHEAALYQLADLVKKLSAEKPSEDPLVTIADLTEQVRAKDMVISTLSFEVSELTKGLMPFANSNATVRSEDSDDAPVVVDLVPLWANEIKSLAEAPVRVRDIRRARLLVERHAAGILPEGAEDVTAASPDAENAPRSVTTALATLRAAGWSVAVHNDYRLRDVPHTFWLLTHENGTWIKGEGTSDEIALGDCLQRARLMGSSPLERIRESVAARIVKYIRGQQGGLLTSHGWMIYRDDLADSIERHLCPRLASNRVEGA